MRYSAAMSYCIAPVWTVSSNDKGILPDNVGR
jgi:hypothetical protein